MFNDGSEIQYKQLQQAMHNNNYRTRRPEGALSMMILTRPEKS
jgi:hypothetical protein